MDRMIINYNYITSNDFVWLQGQTIAIFFAHAASVGVKAHVVPAVWPPSWLGCSLTIEEMMMTDAFIASSTNTIVVSNRDVHNTGVTLRYECNVASDAVSLA